MNIDLFKYEEIDIVSDTIMCLYKELNDSGNHVLDQVIDLYVSNKEFYDFVQKNALIKKIDVNYLLRLYNDFDSDNLVDSYDTIVVNTTRWI